MTLSYRQQRQLRLIEATVRRSDPHLGAMFGIFGRLYPGQHLPDEERLPDGLSGQGRLRRAAAWIMVILTTVVVAISILLGQAVTMVTAGRRAPVQAPAVQHGRTRPQLDGPA